MYTLICVHFVLHKHSLVIHICKFGVVHHIFGKNEHSVKQATQLLSVQGSWLKKGSRRWNLTSGFTSSEPTITKCPWEDTSKSHQVSSMTVLDALETAAFVGEGEAGVATIERLPSILRPCTVVRADSSFVAVDSTVTETAHILAADQLVTPVARRGTVLAATVGAFSSPAGVALVPLLQHGFLAVLVVGALRLAPFSATELRSLPSCRTHDHNAFPSQHCDSIVCHDRHRAARPVHGSEVAASRRRRRCPARNKLSVYFIAAGGVIASSLSLEPVSHVVLSLKVHSGRD